MKQQINREERFFIKRMAISAVNMESALALIDKSIREEQFGYICVTEAVILGSIQGNIAALSCAGIFQLV